MTLCNRWFLVCITTTFYLLTTACSSLPELTPDMARGRTAPAQLDGPHGPLSASQSKAILKNLEVNGTETDIFDLHLAVEASIAGSPLTTGNKIELLQDGPDTYKAMLDAIASARDHINLETYILEDDAIGQRFADALIAKQRSGVQVNLIYDSVGTLYTPAAFFERLTQAGVHIREFNPVNPLTAKAGWTVNQRDHRKLLVVDGRIAFLGGVNISSVYSGSSVIGASHAPHNSELPWRDTHLQIEGPVVTDLQKLFIQTWNKQDGDGLIALNYFPGIEQRGDAIVRAIGSSPDDQYSLIYVTLISALRSAQSEIWLSNAYFVPDPQLLSALKNAATRGVDVRLLLPSSTDSWLVFHAGRAFYHELLEAGVKIYERRGALLHTKTAVIDGVWSTIGSTNLDWRSFLHNQEVNAVILGGDFGTEMRAAFLGDLKQSDSITLAAWRSRPLRNRGKEQFARLWAYWL